MSSRLDERDAEQKTRDALKLRRDDLLRSQSNRFWRAFVEEGREGVRALMQKCKGRNDRIGYNEPNVMTFEARDDAYPAISIRAEHCVDGIQLSYYRHKDAHSESTQEEKFVTFDLDDNDRLVLSCDGRRLFNKDELLEFALGPLFRL
jgi:hypothetical protein